MKLNYLGEPPERPGAEDLEQVPDWAREEYKARLAKEASRRPAPSAKRPAGPRAPAGKKQRVR